MGIIIAELCNMDDPYPDVSAYSVSIKVVLEGIPAKSPTDEKLLRALGQSQPQARRAHTQLL